MPAEARGALNQTNQMAKTNNSVTRDIWIAIGTIIIFLALIPAASYVTRTWGYARVFDLVDIAAVVSRVAVSSALVFLLFRWGFKKTLGRDFGDDFDSGWGAFEPKEKARWIIGAFVALFFAIFTGSAKGESLPISEKGRELIIQYEVGGRTYFEKFLAFPTVPAWQTTASGVTVGFGVDVGHMTRAQIAAAFSGILPADQIRALQSVAGLKGKRAYYEGLPKVKHLVRLDWQQATKVFERDTLPRFSEMTAAAFRIDDRRLHPDQNGALVSLVFNRGAALAGSTRLEMREIREDLATGRDHSVPPRIYAMKRLWAGKGLSGLLRRRDAEAALFASRL